MDLWKVAVILLLWTHSSSLCCFLSPPSVLQTSVIHCGHTLARTAQIPVSLCPEKSLSLLFCPTLYPSPSDSTLVALVEAMGMTPASFITPLSTYSTVMARL